MFRFLLLLSLLLIPACAAPPPAVKPQQTWTATPPSDFSIDATVLSRTTQGGHEIQSRRFTLEPDGTLRYGAGVGKGPLTQPPVVRQLTPKQQQRIWDLVRQEVLTVHVPPSARGPESIELAELPGVGVVQLVHVRAGGQVQSIILTTKTVSKTQGPILEALSKLAWLPSPASPRAVSVKRYDLGPDPYAIYREP